MRPHRQGSAALPQIPNQLVARFELGARRLVAIEIAHQANTEPDVVHVIAVNMAAINLPAPAIANLDLSVPRRRPVSDHEMVGQSIPHSPHSPVIIIERARVPLSRPAVVHDDKFPARALHRGPSDRVDGRAREVTIISRLPRPRPKTTPRRW